jgi:pyrroline-5-carboxylate reductase
MKNANITFIGAGNMAQALIGGLIADGYNAAQLWVTAPRADALQELRKRFAIQTTQDNQAGARRAEVIIFAVKPQLLKTVACELAAIVQEKKPLIISIAAGVEIATLQRWVGSVSAIVRCMPNTPALMGCGATALYANAQVAPEQKNLAESILRAVGLIVWLNAEQQLDTVTALSGCGPAYFFAVMESLVKAGTALGLTPATANLLVLQTALGAARMALESQEPIAELRQRVTSPGGATERALQVLQREGLDKLFADAVFAAQQRSVELGELFGEKNSSK